MNKIYILLFSTICFLSSYLEITQNFSLRVFFTSIFIQLFSVYHIFSDTDKPYSLKKIFYLFSLFFLGFAPFVQFSNKISFWGYRSLLEYEYFYMNLIILFILFGYEILYRYFYKKELSFRTLNILPLFTLNRGLSGGKLLFLFSLSLIAFYLIFYYNKFNFIALLYRGGEFTRMKIDSSVSLIISNFVRPIPVICLLFYLLFAKRNIFFFSAFLVLALLTCSPFGMPRFQVAALYIPVLLSFGLFRGKNVFSILIIVGLMIVFPFLDNFRYLDSTREITVGLNYDMFKEAHFDSYLNFAAIVFNNIITYGRQLLGVLLFFIPRSIWPTKPVGSGAYFADISDFSFTNISANYFAEGYINFGFIGIFIFLILLAYLTAKLDKIYWTKMVFMRNTSFSVVYYVLLGMLFFVLRGDLMSSFAYTMGIFFSIMFVTKIAK